MGPKQPRMNPAGAVSYESAVHTSNDVVGNNKTPREVYPLLESHQKNVFYTTQIFCLLQIPSSLSAKSSYYPSDIL